MRREIIGPCELWLGDCREVMAGLSAGSVDCVIVDPPYGARRPSARRSVDDRFTEIVGNESVDSSWAGLAHGITAEGGCLYSFCTWDTIDEWRRGLRAAGWKVRSCVVWDKEIHGLGDLKTCWAPRHEMVLFAAKGRHELAGSRPVDVIRVPRVPSGDLLHPYQKPVELLVELLRTNTGTVADFFMGSASTGVACIRTNRRFIGCEIDPGYFDIACRRIEREWRLKQSELPFEKIEPAVQREMFDG